MRRPARSDSSMTSSPRDGFRDGSPRRAVKRPALVPGPRPERVVDDDLHVAAKEHQGPLGADRARTRQAGHAPEPTPSAGRSAALRRRRPASTRALRSALQSCERALPLRALPLDVGVRGLRRHCRSQRCSRSAPSVRFLRISMACFWRCLIRSICAFRIAALLFDFF